MVQLNVDYISQKITKKTNQEIDVDQKILKKLTHLHLQESGIHSIGNITICKNLTVLYLQNNYLTKLENLHHATNLTHLYLQQNKISKIENLSTLKKLRKLYLGHNYIAVIEGLDTLHNLEELHIQKQKLSQGETLHFDPRTINGLARCLLILDISGNGLTSIVSLEELCELRKLIARNNHLDDINDITRTVSQWYKVTELELQDNPICSQQKYREKIIICSSSLVSLDGKKINDNTRDFLRRLEISKANRSMAPYLVHDAPTLSSDIACLTKNFTPGVRKSITQSIMEDAELQLTANDPTNKLTGNSFFPPWTNTEANNYPKSGSMIPRPFWRQMICEQVPKRRMKKKIVENFSLPQV